MKTLAHNIIGTAESGIRFILVLGVSLAAHAATFPTAYDTNTDAVAQAFVHSQIGTQVGGSNFITGNVRQQLTNSATWFVATTGNDSNSGTNVSSPFLTIQKGVDAALNYDFGTNNATIQIADGKYQGTIVIKSTASTAAWQNKCGFLVLHGNDASPMSVILTNSITNHLVVAAYGAKAIVSSVYLTSTNRNNECLLDAQSFSYIGFSNVVMGACGATEAQLVAEANGILEALGPYIVSGGGSAHALALGHGTIYVEQPVTFTNTPTFTTAFARAYNGGALFMVGPFTGSVVAPRYNLTSSGSALFSFGAASVDALPGNSDGIQNLDLGQNVNTRSTLQSTLILTNILNTNVDVDSIRFEKYGNDVNGPSVSSFHSRGTTSGAHGAVQADDRLFFLGGGGDDGTALQTNKAIMSFNAEHLWASTSNSTYILFQTTAANNTIRSNSLRLNSDHTLATFGFNTLALGSITVTSSPFTYTTTGLHSEFVYITGGTTSSVTVNGTQVATIDSGCITINLQPGESVVVTYSVAPTMKRKPY